ncbi:MAG: histidinol-phosphatase [Verrucomicrobiales bacterium]|jgi:histidinol-phosphatase (PHP family)|nr:histidinol-phosphatase [Verrucomicrobiales bacterium]
MSRPLLYESHMHTPLCRHATGLPGEYAAHAQRRGLRGIIVTCHSPMPDGFSASVRMRPEQFDEYLSLIAAAADEWRGRVEVLAGLESDYFPGMERWLEKLHQRAPFHYILGSVHPQIKEYTSRHFHGDWPEFHRQYYRDLAAAAETGLFDSLAHPDIVKNQGAECWDVNALLPDICRALDRIAATGVAMELNTSGRLKTVPEMNPAPAIIREIHRRRIPMTIGADAHEPARVADHYEEALTLLRECGFATVSVFLRRQRREIPIQDALDSLRG